jgi:hypothetical protein
MALKNPSPRRVLNLRTLGPVKSTLTTTPPRQLVYTVAPYTPISCCPHAQHTTNLVSLWKWCNSLLTLSRRNLFVTRAGLRHITCSSPTKTELCMQLQICIWCFSKGRLHYRATHDVFSYVWSFLTNSPPWKDWSSQLSLLLFLSQLINNISVMEIKGSSQWLW